jgi:dethiobiotin synthetase
MIRGVFVSAIGTASGKTFVSRGLTRSIARRARRVAALKPFETGVAPDPLDARALAAACGRPDLADAPGLYRAALPLAPQAVALETGEPELDVDRLVARIRELGSGSDFLLVEGAGGLLVPLTARATVADLASRLELPLLIVARDQLGVLSSVLTCVESAERRDLAIAAVVLNQHAGDADNPSDPSPRTNRRILQERVRAPVLTFPACRDDDDALADAAEACGLTELIA